MAGEIAVTHFEPHRHVARHLLEGPAVDGFLDVSQMRDGRLTLERVQVDLAAVATDRLRQMAAQLDDARCATTFDAQPAVGRWDRRRLEQVITNLLSNAIAFGNGRPIEVRVEALAARARLVVRDHGPGIAVEDQRRIFQRFERATRSQTHWGLGLGLWIAHEIVVAHGGTIEVQSELGHGAAFVVELPYSADD